jgi:hypothetical protein
MSCGELQFDFTYNGIDTQPRPRATTNNEGELTLDMNSEITIMGLPLVTTPISSTRFGCLSFL